MREAREVPHSGKPDKPQRGLFERRVKDNRADAQSHRLERGKDSDLPDIARTLGEWDDPVAAVRIKFGQPFQKFNTDFILMTPKERKNTFNWSDDTFTRWINGTSIPERDALIRIFTQLGDAVPAERQAELLQALAEASEVPRRLRERLAAAKEQAVELIAQHAVIADRVEQLQAKATTLVQQLEMVLGSCSGDDDPDRRRRELELRAQLDETNKELWSALRQEHQDSRKLRECATQMAELVDLYLALFAP